MLWQYDMTRVANGRLSLQRHTLVKSYSHRPQISGAILFSSRFHLRTGVRGLQTKSIRRDYLRFSITQRPVPGAGQTLSRYTDLAVAVTCYLSLLFRCRTGQIIIMDWWRASYASTSVQIYKHVRKTSTQLTATAVSSIPRPILSCSF